MASTNKTTHYELSQYIGADKPTYLTDYNQDMSKIDTGIYNSQSKADTLELAVGDLSDLETTVKTDLVSALNEVDTKATNNETHIGNINTLETVNKNNVVSAINEVNRNQSSSSSAIGDLLDLDTTDKSDLVDAINEVNGKTVTNKNAIGNLSNLESTSKTDLVTAMNEIFTFLNLNTFESATNITASKGSVDSGYTSLHVAKNSDGSLAKIYGRVRTTFNSPTGTYYVTFKTSLRPAQSITINTMVFSRLPYANGLQVFMTDLTIASDGTCTTGTVALDTYMGSGDFFFIPCLLFIKDFGDVPIPE